MKSKIAVNCWECFVVGEFSWLQYASSNSTSLQKINSRMETNLSCIENAHVNLQIKTNRRTEKGMKTENKNYNNTDSSTKGVQYSTQI